jgi:hypothetical protein
MFTLLIGQQEGLGRGQQREQWIFNIKTSKNA